MNTGCVRNSDVRRSAAGIALTDGASRIAAGRTNDAPNAAHTVVDDLGRRRLVERDAERVDVDDT